MLVERWVYCTHCAKAVCSRQNKLTVAAMTAFCAFVVLDTTGGEDDEYLLYNYIYDGSQDVGGGRSGSDGGYDDTHVRYNLMSVL